MLNFDFKTYMAKYICFNDIDSYMQKKDNIKNKLYSDKMSGWLNLDSSINSLEIDRIKKLVASIKMHSKALVVIGIGGSYMGSQAIKDIFENYIDSTSFKIIYAGNNLSGKYMENLINYLKNVDFTINVISKSGTTLEPSIAYNLLYKLLNEKYSEEEIKKRIIVTTDATSGTLREIVNKYDYESFTIPNNIGGRYSVLTSVGLLPLAFAGIDIDKILEGAKNGLSLFDKAYEYAVIRNIMFNKKKFVESFTVYEPRLYYFTEWLKQLFAETEGKNKMGILPISTVNSRDLHSLGQFFQDGNPIIFETVLKVLNDSEMKATNKYTYNELNSIITDSVLKAHYYDDTPSNIITINKLDCYTIGQLIMFFFLSAAISGYLFEVDPFNQPGVEKYKSELKNSLKD